MAIFTLAECKTILGIADDADILTTGNVETGSDIITAIPSTVGIREGDTITASAFTSSALVASIPQDGTTLVIDQDSGMTATGQSITITDRGSAYDEQITAFIPIIESFINRYCRETFGSTTNPWPVDLKIPAAKMIWQNVTAIQSAGAKSSESLGDYSVSYLTSVNPGAYAADVLSMLNLYRKVYFI